MATMHAPKILKNKQYVGKRIRKDPDTITYGIRLRMSRLKRKKPYLTWINEKI